MYYAQCVPEYAKSRPLFAVQNLALPQTYFTASNPQFQERDLGGMKKKLLIFFHKLRTLFNFFLPCELDRRGAIVI